MILKQQFPSLNTLAIARGPRGIGARRGQTLVEYALILAVISVVAIGVLINMGSQVKGVYSTIGSAISSAQSSH